MTMSDDHPTGYVDLTKPNADAASSTPEPSAPEPPASGTPRTAGADGETGPVQGVVAVHILPS